MLEHPASLLSLVALAAGMAATGLFSGLLAGLLG
ncbi:MAG: sulfite exporter TauE/SafE family protein, partial [Rhodospirillales bacterium]|nr:sulfite exporter TauE/SafE family protein [Rhodospirillales bacterium]